MTGFDELAETEGDSIFKSWLSNVIDAKQEIVNFVASQRQGKPSGEFNGYLKGSFNLSLVVKFKDGGLKAAVRFPKPGHTATIFQEEKVRNEVQFLKFLGEKTTIPVPRVVSWGTVHGRIYGPLHTKEQFLRALERVEARTKSDGDQSNSLLSDRMRDSWKTGTF
jgi:hypothetical protein